MLWQHTIAKGAGLILISVHINESNIIFTRLAFMRFFNLAFDTRFSLRFYVPRLFHIIYSPSHAFTKVGLLNAHALDTHDII